MRCCSGSSSGAWWMNGKTGGSAVVLPCTGRQISLELQRRRGNVSECFECPSRLGLLGAIGMIGAIGTIGAIGFGPLTRRPVILLHAHSMFPRSNRLFSLPESPLPLLKVACPGRTTAVRPRRRGAAIPARTESEALGSRRGALRVSRLEGEGGVVRMGKGVGGGGWLEGVGVERLGLEWVGGGYGGQAGNAASGERGAGSRQRRTGSR